MIATNISFAVGKPGVKDINLRERFGRRLRIGYEESYFVEHGQNARVEDPALMIIPCHNGEIYPAGGSKLAASTNHPGRVANKLKAMACCAVYQDGDDGITVTFDVADFEQVAAVMKPRSKRTLNPEQKAKLVAAGIAHRRGRQEEKQVDEFSEKVCGDSATSAASQA